MPMVTYRIVHAKLLPTRMLPGDCRMFLKIIECVVILVTLVNFYVDQLDCYLHNPI